MTPEQHANWLDFARRMAMESNRWRTERRRQRVVEEVCDLIDCFVRDWGLAMIGTWDGQQIGGEGGRIVQRYGRDHLEIAYPCDEFDSMMEGRGYVHYREDVHGGYEEILTDFASSIICCIRAGFDVAVAPSAGVIGSRYTAGMLRRMFPSGLPAYVDDFFHGEGTNPDAPRFETLPDSLQLWL